MWIFLIFVSYFYIIFGEMFFKPFAYTGIKLDFFFLASGILYILDINPLSDVLVLNTVV